MYYLFIAKGSLFALYLLSKARLMVCGENAKSANYAEVDFYPITEKQAKSTARAKKAQVTSEMQAKRNAETARRNLVQKLNTNFTNDDYTGVLCYDENNLPKNQKQATRDFRNFIRKVQAFLLDVFLKIYQLDKP